MARRKGPGEAVYFEPAPPVGEPEPAGLPDVPEVLPGDVVEGVSVDGRVEPPVLLGLLDEGVLLEPAP